MRESFKYGSVRGAVSNDRPYRDNRLFGFRFCLGPVVISGPSFLVAVVAHVSPPNGEPRLTLRRMAARSASD